MLEALSALWQGLSTLGSYFGFTFILFVISKHLWRQRVLKSAEDHTSPLTTKLPIPPGDFGIPFIGETLSWAMQGSKFNSTRRKTYGKIFSTHFLGNVMVKVTGASNVRQILQGEHDKVTTIWPSTVRSIIGEHSISHCPEDKHKYMRKLALKGFSQSALNGYIPGIRKIISAKALCWKSPGVQKIYKDILQMTFEASMKSMTGFEIESKRERDYAYQTFHEMILNMFSFPCDLPFSGFRKALKNRKIINDLIDSHIRGKLKEALSNNDCTTSNDVLQHMINGDLSEKRKRESKDSGIEESDKSSGEEEERIFNAEEFKQTAVELMFGGYMTTGSGISSIIIKLGQHPEVREKVRAELDENGLLEPEDCLEITLERIQKLTYLEQVIKETLRVMPAILGGYRKALKTFQLGDYRIPKDWTIIYNIRDTHEYEFEEDMDFNPDRFSKEVWAENKENRFKWIPFGSGPRVCLGKEYGRLMMKLAVIELIRSFSEWNLEGNKMPPMYAIPTLHPTNGLPVIFTPREE